MERLYVTLFVIALSISSAQARVLEEEKRELIDQMLELSGVSQVVGYMASTLTMQIYTSLSKTHGKLNPAVVDIIHSEAQTILYEEYILSNRLNEIYYALYDEEFSTEDLHAMVEFFSTDAGKRTLEALPIISQKSQEQAKIHAKAISGKVQQRILDKLKEVSEAIAAGENPTATQID